MNKESVTMGIAGAAEIILGGSSRWKCDPCSRRNRNRLWNGSYLPYPRRRDYKFRASAPAINLLDVQMPEMAGYETAAKLKSDRHLSSVPIVRVSSFVMPGDRYKAMRAGFDVYIEKSVEPDTFCQTIVRLAPGQVG